MTDNFHNYEFSLPSEALALAEAISLRDAQNRAELRQVVAEIQGQPYEAPTLDQQSKDNMGRTVLLLARVSDPSMPISIKDIMESRGESADLNAVVTELGNNGIHIDVADLNSARHNLMAEVSDESGYSEHHVAEEFSRDMQAARKIAQDEGVDPVDVFSDDKLNAQLYATTHDIQDVAEITKKTILIAERIFSKARTSLVNSVINSSSFGYMSPREIEELRVELIESLKSNPNLIAEQQDMIEAKKQYMLGKVVTSWGTDKAYTEYLADPELMPERPLVDSIMEKVIANSGSWII